MTVRDELSASSMATPIDWPESVIFMAKPGKVPDTVSLSPATTTPFSSEIFTGTRPDKAIGLGFKAPEDIIDLPKA